MLTGGYRSTLVLAELLFLAQGLVGGGLYLRGHLLRDPLHLLYGVLLVLALPIAASYSTAREPRREPLVFGIVGLFMVGLTVRAFMTG